MNTLIKAVEVWLPSTDASLLEFGGGLYGRATGFGARSRLMCFGRGEGLPGRAWDEGQPLVLLRLENSYFRRASAAREAGFRGAVAIPAFIGAKLMAVTVLFCGEDGQRDGAIELHSGSGMGLAHAEGTAQTRLNRRLALRCATAAGDVRVVALRAAGQVPIARRVERWLPDEARHALQRTDGFCEAAGLLRGPARMAAGAGAIGRAFISGTTVLNEHAAREPGGVGTAAKAALLQALAAVPVAGDEGEEVSEVLALYL